VHLTRTGNRLANIVVCSFKWSNRWNEEDLSVIKRFSSDLEASRVSISRCSAADETLLPILDQCWSKKESWKLEIRRTFRLTSINGITSSTSRETKRDLESGTGRYSKIIRQDWRGSDIWIDAWHNLEKNTWNAIWNNLATFGDVSALPYRNFVNIATSEVNKLWTDDEFDGEARIRVTRAYFEGIFNPEILLGTRIGVGQIFGFKTVTDRCSDIISSRVLKVHMQRDVSRSCWKMYDIPRRYRVVLIDPNVIRVSPFMSVTCLWLFAQNLENIVVSTCHVLKLSRNLGGVTRSKYSFIFMTIHQKA